MYPSLLAPSVSDATPKHVRDADGSPAAGNFGFSPSKRQLQEASPKSSIGFESALEGTPAKDDIQNNEGIDLSSCRVRLDFDAQDGGRHEREEGEDPEAQFEEGDLHHDLLGVCMANAGFVEPVLFAAAGAGADGADGAEAAMGDWFDDEAQDASGDEGVAAAGENNFTMFDESSSDEGDNMELEDAYNFDHNTLASLIREGADRETLIQAAQEGMSEAFIDRMQDVGYVEVEGDWLGDDATEIVSEEEVPAAAAAATEPAEATAAATESAEATAVSTVSAEATAVATVSAVAATVPEQAAAAATESAEGAPPLAKKGRSRNAAGARLFGHALTGLGTRRRGRRQTPPSSEDENRPDMGSMSANMTPEVATTPENATTPALAGTPQAGTPGRMTPPPVSPPVGAGAAGDASPRKATAVDSPGVPAEALAERLRDTPGRQSVGRQSVGRRLTTRRSSVRRSSIVDAMSTQREMARKSVHKQMTTVLSSLASETDGDLQDAPEVKAQAKEFIRAQRMGMEKAGDILEDADVDDEDTEEVTKQLRSVQGILSEASLRHRKAIVLAHKDAVNGETSKAMENIPEEASDEETKVSDQPQASSEPVSASEATAAQDTASVLTQSAAAAKSDLKATAPDFKPSSLLSAEAKEWKPVDANSSLQDKMQDAIRQAYLRKISSKPVPASSVPQQPRGQGPVWTPGTATATPETTLKERMQNAAKEARDRRAGEGTGVLDRIAQARNEAAAAREGTGVLDRITQARSEAAAARCQGMGSPVGSPHGDTWSAGFGDTAGWDPSADGSYGQSTQQWDAASANGASAYQAGYGSGMHPSNTAQAGYTSGMQPAGYAAGASQATAGWTEQKPSANAQWEAGWDQQAGAASEWNASAQWTGAGAANPWNAQGGAWAGY